MKPASAVRTIFANPTPLVAEQLDSIAGKLGRQFPAVEAMLRDSATDICAFAALPAAHWKKIWSTNPLERVNKEIKRCTNVVGISPRGTARRQIRRIQSSRRYENQCAAPDEQRQSARRLRRRERPSPPAQSRV